jgi:hypothetical protein
MRALVLAGLTITMPARANDPSAETAAPGASSATELKRSGIFAEVALGPGFFYARTAADDARTFTGASIAGQFVLGGTPARGLVLAGAYFRDEILGMSASDEVVDGDEPELEDVGFSLDRFGLFADIFPDPDGGLHFQGLAAVGVLNTRRPGGDADDPGGLLISVAGGYAWGLGGAFYLGPLVRLTYAPLTSDETSQGDDLTRVFSPALLVTATFHGTVNSRVGSLASSSPASP